MYSKSENPRREAKTDECKGWLIDVIVKNDLVFGRNLLGQLWKGREKRREAFMTKFDNQYFSDWHKCYTYTKYGKKNSLEMTKNYLTHVKWPLQRYIDI